MKECVNWMNMDAVRETVRKHREKWGNPDEDPPYDLSDLNVARNCLICDFGGTGSPLLDQLVRVVDEKTTRLQDYVKQLSGTPMKRVCFKECSKEEVKRGMTPEESIARLSLYTEPGTWVLGKHDIRAIQQGIGALKRVQDMRISPCTTADELLPGESEE